MYLVWSDEWDCEDSPSKFETLEELQEWLQDCITPIEYLEFYYKIENNQFLFY